MALLKKIINEVGQVIEYHRIKSIECDYTQEQMHIFIESYTNNEYRNYEKIEKHEIMLNINKIKKSKKLNVEDKINQLQGIEAKQIQNRSLRVLKYTLAFKDIFRKNIYKRLLKEIPEFEGSEEV